MAQMLFTEIAIRALKGSDRYETHFDTKLPGFGVRVGKRSKTFLVLRGKARERITIGRYPDMSLSAARAKAKQLLASQSETKQPRVSFEKARDEYLASFPTGTHRYHLTLTFKKHFASLTDRQLADIEDADVREALDKIAGPSARLHAFRAIRAFFRWSVRPPRRYLRHNPLEGYQAPGTDKKGTRTLTDQELDTLYKAAEGSVARVFRLLVLWGTRSGETVAIRRDWLVDDVLTIPGEFTKNARDHAIPLLPEAKRILDSLPVRTNDDGTDNPYYFPGRGESHITSHSLVKILKQLQEKHHLSGFTARDIRRTFRSNMARLNVPREVCEVLINHAPPVLDEIYDRYDRLTEKRDALERYEAFVLNLSRPGH